VPQWKRIQRTGPADWSSAPAREERVVDEAIEKGVQRGGMRSPTGAGAPRFSPDPNGAVARHTSGAQMDDAVDILEGELGGQVPDGLTQLGDEQLLALADLLQDAKARGQEELREGVEDSLSFVPRLMRGPVRRILFG